MCHALSKNYFVCTFSLSLRYLENTFFILSKLVFSSYTDEYSLF